MAAMVINANTTAVPTQRNVVTAVPIISPTNERNQKEKHKTTEENVTSRTQKKRHYREVTILTTISHTNTYPQKERLEIVHFRN